MFVALPFDIRFEAAASHAFSDIQEESSVLLLGNIEGIRICDTFSIQFPYHLLVFLSLMMSTFQDTTSLIPSSWDIAR